MNACGVERQPPRLPAGITRALGQCSRTAGLTRSSINTISACRNAFTALSVSNSGSPGPAPTSQTFAFMVSPWGVYLSAHRQLPACRQAPDLGHAGAAAGAAFKLMLQAV